MGGSKTGEGCCNKVVPIGCICAQKGWNLRFGFDFGCPDAVTKPDGYTIPQMSEWLRSMGKARYKLIVEVNSGY